MKGTNKLTNIMSHDKQILSLFSGLVLCSIALLSIFITAFVWYI